MRLIPTPKQGSRRLLLWKWLQDRKRGSAAALAAASGLSASEVSRYMTELLRAGVVERVWSGDVRVWVLAADDRVIPRTPLRDRIVASFVGGRWSTTRQVCDQVQRDNPGLPLSRGAIAHALKIMARSGLVERRGIDLDARRYAHGNARVQWRLPPPPE